MKSLFLKKLHPKYFYNINNLFDGEKLNKKVSNYLILLFSIPNKKL